MLGNGWAILDAERENPGTLTSLSDWRGSVVKLCSAGVNISCLILRLCGSCWTSFESRWMYGPLADKNG